MTETELENLRKELRDEFNRLHAESIKYDKLLGTADADLFFGKSRKARAQEKKDSIEKIKNAVRNFQEKIERGSTATPEEQEAA